MGRRDGDMYPLASDGTISKEARIDSQLRNGTVHRRRGGPQLWERENCCMRGTAWTQRASERGLARPVEYKQKTRMTRVRLHCVSVRIVALGFDRADRRVNQCDGFSLKQIISAENQRMLTQLLRRETGRGENIGAQRGTGDRR